VESLDEFPNVKVRFFWSQANYFLTVVARQAWLERLLERPGFKAGIAVPGPNLLSNLERCTTVLF
jgi:hypothetical protein